jgi:predicted nucleic acid-binding protein
MVLRCFQCIRRRVKVNFTGALSFTLMRREKITEAFTFGRYFSFAGFQVFEG